jgi:chaperonin GroES
MDITKLTTNKEVIPLGNKVLIKRIEEKRQGSIIIPDIAKKKPKEAIVIAVGKGRILDDGSREVMDVSPGDTIIFSNYYGVDEIELDKKADEYILLRQQDILAIVREKKDCSNSTEVKL